MMDEMTRDISSTRYDNNKLAWSASGEEEHVPGGNFQKMTVLCKDCKEPEFPDDGAFGALRKNATAASFARENTKDEAGPPDKTPEYAVREHEYVPVDLIGELRKKGLLLGRHTADEEPSDLPNQKQSRTISISNNINVAAIGKQTPAPTALPIESETVSTSINAALARSTKALRQLLDAVTILVIDEVSTQALPHTAQRLATRELEPFGRIPILLVGDVVQLAPVVTADQLPEATPGKPSALVSKIDVAEKKIEGEQAVCCTAVVTTRYRGMYSG